MYIRTMVAVVSFGSNCQPHLPTIQRPTTMFDTHIMYLERLGTKCGVYQLEKVLRHDRIRTCYLAVGPDDQFYEVQLFEEGFYWSKSVHQSINDYVAALQHKGITKTLDIVDSGYGSGGEPYLVSRKSNDGTLLSEILDRRKIIELDQCLRIGIQLSAILIEMHSKGIFHGCLSPRSIIVEQEGAVISDMATGYVASLASKPDTDSAGIPLYMSPERLEGAAASAASDTYALALILYECITGLPPHSSATATELALQRHNAPPSLSSATDVTQPSAVEVFFRKALSSKARERFPDAQEFSEALVSVQRRKPVAPDFNSLKIPHRYNILRHPSETNLSDLQRTDAVAARAEIRSSQLRNHIVKAVFALSALTAIGIYVMTLTCLASMHQQLGAITQSIDESAATTSDIDNFVLNPPKLAKDELAGDTKLDSVLKFSTGYGLRADSTVGNFRSIARLNKLEYLSVTNTAISDSDLEALRWLPLRYLDISNCRNITARGFETIQKMYSLRVLRADHLPLTATDLAKLNPELIELRLKNCNLDDSCVDQFARIKKIRRLELSNNQITRQSFKTLSSLSKLYYIDLQSNPKLTADDQVELCKLMPRTAIRFNFATPSNKSVFENLKLAKLIKKFNGIDLNVQGSSGDFSEITKFKNLEELDLSRSTIKDHDFAGFAKLPLRFIGLNNCQIGSGALKELQEMPDLMIMEASTSGLRDGDLEYLNPNLRELDLSSCQITDKGVSKLRRLKHLVSLNLNNNSLSQFAFENLRKLKSLRLLDLRDCPDIHVEQAKVFEDSLPDTTVLLNRIRH
ncbi:MAG: protein kinase [Cyanobacteria bacterium SZAS-4]|nr:protein kinase [Cyanobacteria bacterium SZAS-4]